MRRAAVVDSQRLADLYAQCFVMPWQAKDFTVLLANAATISFVSQTGFIVGRIVGDDAEIITIGVLSAARRQGHAAQLLNTFVQQLDSAKRIILEVNENNLPAISLYQQHGFAAVTRRPDYYYVKDHFEDAILMIKSL